MTSDCSFLYTEHLAFVIYVLCKQHHALLWSMKYKEKGQKLSLCLSVLAVSHNGVCVTRLVLLGAFWEVFSSLGYVSERLWPHLALQLLCFLSCQGLEKLALPHAPHMLPTWCTIMPGTQSNMAADSRPEPLELWTKWIYLLCSWPWTFEYSHVKPMYLYLETATKWKEHCYLILGWQ